MNNDAIKGAGPGSLGDLARMGGDVAGELSNADAKGRGPGFIQDLARMGGAVLGPAISGTPVLTGKKDTAYAGFTVKGAGGNGSLTYALVGTWPAGIAVNSSTGVVAGTPTADGTFAGLSVKVTDSDGDADQLPSFTLVVAA